MSEEATDAARVSRYLKTQEGKKLYAKRKSIVEPVFGIMKSVMDFRQFMLRDIEKVKGDCLTLEHQKAAQIDRKYGLEENN